MSKPGRNISVKSSRTSLEKTLNLKQLQISRILNITQAINSNVAEEGLYDMYKSFLTWELGVSRMALYTIRNDKWQMISSQGVSRACMNQEFIGHILNYKKISTLEKGQLFDQGFELIIPVHHKETPIAYVLIGGIKLNDHDELYNIIQLITTITNIIAVAIENKRLFKRQLEQQGLKKEMQLGRDIQQMLVPQELPGNQHFEIDCIYLPKLSIGGDYYDFIRFYDSQFAFCIGDISGKGIGAALLMANFQANFQTLIRQRVPLAQFISSLNTSVNQITKGQKFITFFVAEVDLNKGELRYINAGHNPPMLRSGGSITRLTKGCTILGSFNELPEIEIGIEPLQPGDLIVAYTDGLVEIKDEHGHFFSESMLKEHILGLESKSAKDINKSIKAVVDKFHAEKTYPDDLTLLSCLIKSLS